jgi:hypothetical protein
MDEKGTGDIVKGAKDTLSFAVLGRSVWTGETKVSALSRQKRGESY